MPCRDPRDDEDCSVEILRDLNKVTRMLCHMCRTGKMTREIKQWFEEHDRFDKERKKNDPRPVTQ